MLAYDQRDNLSFNQAGQGSIILLFHTPKHHIVNLMFYIPRKIYIKKAKLFFIVENAGIEAMKLRFSKQD